MSWNSTHFKFIYIILYAYVTLIDRCEVNYDPETDIDGNCITSHYNVFNYVLYISII